MISKLSFPTLVVSLGLLGGCASNAPTENNAENNTKTEATDSHAQNEPAVKQNSNYTGIEISRAARAEVGKVLASLDTVLKPKKSTGRLGILDGVEQAKLACANLGAAEAASSAAESNFEILGRSTSKANKKWGELKKKSNELVFVIQANVDAYCAVNSGDKKKMITQAEEAKKIAWRVREEISVEE